MSRSGYVDDLAVEDPLAYGRWRAQVASAIRGTRGQAFLRELAAAMDAMPEKRLIAGELVDQEGECCTLGVVCQSRALDVAGIDLEDTEAISKLLGIAHQLVAEIEFENDESHCGQFTPENRWSYMRHWVQRHLRQADGEGVVL